MICCQFSYYAPSYSRLTDHVEHNRYNGFSRLAGTRYAPAEHKVNPVLSKQGGQLPSNNHAMPENCLNAIEMLEWFI